MKHRERYLRPLDAIGHHKVADVEKRHIIAIRNAIAAASGNGAATAFARAASVLFGWAVEAGWITHSPTYRMKALPIGAWQAWTPEQAETALSSLPEHYRRVVVLGLLTGQRRGDLCALRWSNYDGDRLMIVQQKTGSVVSLSVHPELKAELDAWPRVAETILTNAFGKPWNPEVLSTTLPYQLGKLGVSGSTSTGCASSSLPGWPEPERQRTKSRRTRDTRPWPWCSVTRKRRTRKSCPIAPWVKYKHLQLPVRY
jgi:integrase